MQSSNHQPPRFLEVIQDSMLAIAEIGSNHLLGYDEDALRGCRELEGHCIAIQISDLDIQLFCHPGSWGIRLASQPPARPVDATISGRLMALVNLAIEEDKVSTSIQERVSFQGNVALAQKLQKILAGLDIDWEEMLATRTGDVVAHQIHQRALKLGDYLRTTADSLLQTSSEYLREEARLSPTQVEFDRFQSQLTQLKHDVARSEQRLQSILQKIDST